MSIEEMKQFLQNVKDDPALARRENDQVDDALLGVIRLEKKHLYGVGTTSANKRREEIERYLDKTLAEIVEGQ